MGSIAAAVLELQYCKRNGIKLGNVAAAVLELQYCYRNEIKLGKHCSCSLGATVLP